jgi:hypothetical protein
VEAAAHLFEARWAAMVFSGDYPGIGIARVFVHAGDCVIQRWGLPPRMLAALTERTLAAQRPVLAEHATRGLSAAPCPASWWRRRCR